MTEHLTPVAVCERLFGGPVGVAEILGYDRSAPFHWRRSSKLRQAGDLPSAAVQRRLLAHAAARAIPLTADHLIWGASAEEIDALTVKPAHEMAPAMIEAAE